MKRVKEIMIIMLCLAAMLGMTIWLTGCQETQQKNRWGQGDTPADWQKWFGNDNSARLSFVQMRALERQQGIIFGINTKDPTGKPTRKRGLIERVTTLEDLTDRVEKLEHLTRFAEEQDPIDLRVNKNAVKNREIPKDNQ